MFIKMANIIPTPRGGTLKSKWSNGGRNNSSLEQIPASSSNLCYCGGLPSKYPELLRADSRLLQGFWIYRQAHPSSIGPTEPLAECRRHSPRSENGDHLESNPQLLDCESDALVISHPNPEHSLLHSPPRSPLC